MDWFWQSIHDHEIIWMMGTYYVFSNGVSSMPTPGTASTSGYRWGFDFLHLMAGNISRVIATRYPQLPVTVVETSKITPTEEGGLKQTVTTTTTPQEKNP